VGSGRTEGSETEPAVGLEKEFGAVIFLAHNGPKWLLELKHRLNSQLDVADYPKGMPVSKPATKGRLVSPAVRPEKKN
jgi:hypothetical protein